MAYLGHGPCTVHGSYSVFTHFATYGAGLSIAAFISYGNNCWNKLTVKNNHLEVFMLLNPFETIKTPRSKFSLDSGGF